MPMSQLYAKSYKNFSLSPGLVSSTRLGMMEEIIDRQEDEESGIIQAIPKKKAK